MRRARGWEIIYRPQGVTAETKTHTPTGRDSPWIAPYIVCPPRAFFRPRVLDPAVVELGRARMRVRTTGETATLYGETRYAARRWDRKRRIIMKAEVLRYPGRSPKDNPRFLVTNLPHRPVTAYTRLYCGRGDMENRLKELQHGVAMDRTSCSRFVANQLRLLFSVAAYALLQALDTWRELAEKRPSPGPATGDGRARPRPSYLSGGRDTCAPSITTAGHRWCDRRHAARRRRLRP